MPRTATRRDNGADGDRDTRNKGHESGEEKARRSREKEMFKNTLSVFHVVFLSGEVSALFSYYSSMTTRTRPSLVPSLPSVFLLQFVSCHRRLVLRIMIMIPLRKGGRHMGERE